jgi:hypothetical protein
MPMTLGRDFDPPPHQLAHGEKLESEVKFICSKREIIALN